MSDHVLLLVVLGVNVINAAGSTIRTIYAHEKRKAARARSNSVTFTRDERGNNFADASWAGCPSRMRSGWRATS
jgi:hypothetical protein